MKILITGNMGYVGPSVVQQLRRSRPEAVLIGLDAGYFASLLTGTDLLPERRLDVQYLCDVRTPPSEVLREVDAVVHLAAISNDPMGSAFEAPTFEINHRATVDLAIRARDAGASAFVFASSCSVYGSAEDAPRVEASPLDPLTAYARSKVAAERELAGLADADFAVTSLRFATACGMSERLRLDLVLNDFVAAAVTSGTIQILSDGSPWRPLIHVGDMARAIDWAIGRDPAAVGPFLSVNAGSDRWNCQIRDLASAVARVIPGTTVEVNANAAPDRRSYRVDFSLFARLAPDHQPVWDLPDTIAEIEQGLRRMGFSDRGFRRSRHVRLNVLSDLRERGILDEALRWTDTNGSGHPSMRTEDARPCQR